ncbi:MAG: transcriptional regulator [Gemmatimonadota bacterium]
MSGEKGGGSSMDWIDPVIHSPNRLKIVVELYVVEAADATFLLNQTGLTWGNLSTHLGKLEESGYVELEKGYDGKKPRTMIKLTDRGRAAFQEYRTNMQKALDELPD